MGAGGCPACVGVPPTPYAAPPPPALDFFAAAPAPPATPPAAPPAARTAPAGPAASGGFAAPAGPAVSAPDNPLFSWSGEPTLGQRPVPPPPPSLAQRPRERRSPVTIVLGALGVLVVVGLVAAYLMSQHTAATQTLTVINHSIDQARATEQKAALTDAATAEESWAVDHAGAYSADVTNLDLARTANVTVTVVSASATGYCLEATVTTPPGVTPPPPWFYAGQGGGLTSTPCH